MRSKIEKEISGGRDVAPRKGEKTGRSRNSVTVEEEISSVKHDFSSNENIEISSGLKAVKTDELGDVKCLECHCVGTVMKTIDGLVLLPENVKKTLLELGKGNLMPQIHKAKPTVSIANQKLKKFVEGFNEHVGANMDDDENGGFFQRSINRIRKFRERFARGVENAQGDKTMELVKTMKRAKTKTSAEDVPERFRGFLSDEFENDKFWKSNKRLSLQLVLVKL